MSATVERIRQEIDQLAPEEARELFADLTQNYSVQFMNAAFEAGEDEATVEAAWDAEIDSRIQEIENGTVQLLTPEESERRTDAVFARLGIQRQVFQP